MQATDRQALRGRNNTSLRLAVAIWLELSRYSLRRYRLTRNCNCTFLFKSYRLQRHAAYPRRREPGYWSLIVIGKPGRGKVRSIDQRRAMWHAVVAILRAFSRNLEMFQEIIRAQSILQPLGYQF
jgi:hypothetical protein